MEKGQILYELTIDSPCVMGIFHHMIAFKSLNYPMKDIELVLMHEGTHIVRRDNLGKKLALLIVLVTGLIQSFGFIWMIWMHGAIFPVTFTCAAIS